MDLWEGPQDRAGAMRWLVTLRALQREAPGLFIAPGHDVYALTDPQHPSRMTLID
jgi:hypothetical protein